MKLIKLKEELNKDWQDIQDNKLKSILTLIRNIIVCAIITIIILYYLTRPIECTLKNNTKIKLEEIKFNYQEIKQCKYTIITDFQNMYKAYKTEIRINQTEENIEWQKQTINPNP